MTAPRYPFRWLKGPITVYRSARAPQPKLHLLRACEGLARVPDDAVVAEEFRHVRDAIELRDARPCRLCALSSFVISMVLESGSEPQVPFSVTSHPSPHRIDGDPYRTEYRKATDSGTRRLTRLSKRLGWTLAMTPLGPVAAGTAGQSAVEFISRNLRTAAIPAGIDANLPTVELFWTLAADAPPEAGADIEFSELWSVAERLLGSSSG